MDRYNKIENYVLEKKKILNNKKNTFNIISIDDFYCKELYNSKEFINNIPISIIKPINNGVYILGNKLHDNYFFKNKIIILKNISDSLTGSFNLQNILATYVVSQIFKFDKNFFLKLIKNFVGLPHRLEKIFENNKLLIINNSKATNLDSTIKSIENYNNIYLIIGGRAKDENFKLLKKFSKKIYKCFIIGESSKSIYNQINNFINCQKSLNLSNVVKEIFQDIKDNNFKSTILFSPGCASFDQFKNFEDRGNFFKKIIQKKLKTKIR